MRRFGLINVVLHPHPMGAYFTLFLEAASRRLARKYYGDRYAAISPISRFDKDVFTGLLATWSEVDRTAKTINLSSLEQQVFDSSGVVIPDNVGLNSKVFNFAFHEPSHQLIIELENDEGQSISARQALNAFTKALRVPSDDEEDQVKLHLITKDDAIAQILALPIIRSIEIDLFWPNPDDLSEIEREILEELEEEGAKRRKVQVTKSPTAGTLSLNERDTAMAGLAKDNGSVTASGRDENNEKIVLSTKEMPKFVYRGTPDDSGAVLVRNIASEFEAPSDDLIE